MRLVLLIVLAASLAHCSPVATYPPIEVDSAVTFSNSTYEPVPTVLVTSIEYARDHFGGSDAVVYNLPEGMTAETYDIVTSRVENSRPMQNMEEVAYHITQLRVRGLRAEADVVYPAGGGEYQTATMYLSKSIADPWTVKRARVWAIPVSVVPTPNYSETEQSASVDAQ